MHTRPKNPTYRFSTEHAPSSERFDAWRADTSALFDIDSLSDEGLPYDSSFDFTLLDQIMFGGRDWAQSSRQVTHEMSRSARRIRSDGLDGYYLQLQISERFEGYAGKTVVRAGPGDLCLIDLASPFQLTVTTGDTICLNIPRELLPANVARMHGRSPDTGMGLILADYLRSLRKNLPTLTADEMAYVTQATRNMLQACLSPTADTIQQASVEMNALAANRILAYIDQHLLSPDLSPDRICKSLGISRSKLYRLFEPVGGVMRQIQRKRLMHARNTLVSQNRSRRMRIAEVAWEHGFGSEKHFSRLFKERFGCTPSEMIAEGLHAEFARCRSVDPKADTRRSNFSEWMRNFVSR